jgi:NADPH:quinone reductase-like Zn-dependent oxidoreductase
MTRATLTPPTGPTAANNPAQTMKAIVQDKYGTAPQEVWRLEEIARPTIGDDAVLIQVRAAALDMGTWHTMTGLPYLLRLIVPAFGLRGPKHAVPGGDVAGLVAAVGANVTRFKVGDEAERSGNPEQGGRRWSKNAACGSRSSFSTAWTNWMRSARWKS